MKKIFVTFLLINMITLSFAVPVMATEAVVVEPVNMEIEQEVTPRTEMTQTFWRTYNGQLQMRVWSITNGRWLTDWMDL